MFIKALQRYRADETQAMIRFLQGPGHALDKIRSLLNKTVDSILSDGEHKGCFIANTAVELVNHDPEIARLAQDNQQEIEAALTQTIRDGQAAGQIASQQDTGALAQYLLNNFNGLQIVGKMNPDKHGVDRSIAKSDHWRWVSTPRWRIPVLWMRL